MVIANTNIPLWHVCLLRQKWVYSQGKQLTKSNSILQRICALVKNQGFQNKRFSNAVCIYIHVRLRKDSSSLKRITGSLKTWKHSHCNRNELQRVYSYDFPQIFTFKLNFISILLGRLCSFVRNLVMYHSN